MRVSRLRTGEWLTALGAIVLLVSLFALRWHDESLRHGWFSYSPLSGTGYGGRSRHGLAALVAPARTGWAAMPTLRWLVLITGVLGIALAVAQAASAGPALPVTLDLLAMLVAGATTVLVIVRLAVWGSPLCFGAVLGSLACVAVTCGAYQAMRTEQGWTVTAQRPVQLIDLD